jgi:integrase/recombinase XerD
VNTLRAAASDYLTLRGALGFKLYDAGLLLEQFIDFLQANHADTITTALAVQWATEPRGVLPAWHARRLGVVRGFARWRQATDPVTEVPPNGLLPAHTRRAPPYLYSGEEITALMAAAARLPSPLTAATMKAFIGLVFATGIRRGEALGLDDGDVDPAAAILTVRRAKLDKTRRLPLHRSTVAALIDYQHRRDRLIPNLAADALFVSTTGARLSATTVSGTFRALLPRAGIQPPAPARRPHIHDARHTFAVNTLLEWYRDGGDVAARLPLLSAYLGHTSPVHTYWYLSAAPELLALAAGRLEACTRPGVRA